jgi:polysaccharide export outer membrane protein
MPPTAALVRAAALTITIASPAWAQSAAGPVPANTAPTAATAAATAQPLTPPAGYVIGPDDVIEVIFYKDEQSSSKDVPVRPDGKVSLTLLNEMHAAGLTPEQFRLEVTKAAAKYITDPVVSVNIKQINSRRVYISGMIAKPGAYPLGQPLTISQLIATAGGVHEYADKKKIIIVRTGADGNPTSFRFNWDDFEKGKNLKQDIELKPGDRIVVP